MIGIGFGTWAWGNKLLWGYNSTEDDILLEKSFQIAIKGGLNLIDTADSYGTGKLNGRSEELLGKFMESISLQKKKKIIIATKLAPYPWRQSKKSIQRAFNLSKQRLKGHISRFQLHWRKYRCALCRDIKLLHVF